MLSPELKELAIRMYDRYRESDYDKQVLISLMGYDICRSLKISDEDRDTFIGIIEGT